MNGWEIILLAVVQGLTEFLPVSSSGHLALLQWLFGPSGESDLSLTIFLHVGTLLALFLYFRNDLLRLARSIFFRPLPVEKMGNSLFPPQGRERHYLGLILLGSVPTAAIGLALRTYSDAAFGQPAMVGFFLLVTAALLAAPRILRPHSEGSPMISPWQALVIGAVQGMAVLPGISRSGSTIVAGILLGIEGKNAARFSFHLSIPAVLGAFILEGIGSNAWQAWAAPLPLLGLLISAVTGFAAIGLLMRVVARRRLAMFSYYCGAVGLAVLVVSAFSIPW